MRLGKHDSLCFEMFFIQAKQLPGAERFWHFYEMQMRCPLPAMTFFQLGTMHKAEPTGSASGFASPGLILRISSLDMPNLRVMAMTVSPFVTSSG